MQSPVEVKMFHVVVVVVVVVVAAAAAAASPVIIMPALLCVKSDQDARYSV